MYNFGRLVDLLLFVRNFQRNNTYKFKIQNVNALFLHFFYQKGIWKILNNTTFEKLNVFDVDVRGPRSVLFA